ncbi:MAG: TIR domain-containing protein [Methanothrix sp.]
MHEPTVWNDGTFCLTKSTLAALIDRLDKSDAAIFVLSPDDITTIRGNELPTARGNVIFELGLFIGRLGPRRTFFVIPGGNDLNLLSDLAGITAATYIPNRSDGDLVAALSPACFKIEGQLDALQQEPPSMIAKNDPMLKEGMAWMQDYVNRALMAFLSQTVLPSPEASGIKSMPDGFRTSFRRTELQVKFGRIEKSEARETGSAVALPATEFFDDDCASDQRSALGAYLNLAFPGKLAEVQRTIVYQLKNEKTEIVEREPGANCRSFGVGKCIYLDNILGSGRNVILVSVTTKHAGVGIRCEPYFLFAAMNAICQTMNDHRLNHLELPVMGSGHGGLEPELALLYLILTIKKVVESSPGTHLNSVSIVVFQKDPTAETSIPRDTVARILSVAKTNL